LYGLAGAEALHFADVLWLEDVQGLPGVKNVDLNMYPFMTPD
jgi:hypothetical protein